MTQTQKQNVPKLRFPEFEEDWRTLRLDEVTSKIQDGTHFSPEVQESGPYKYITSKNIRNGQLDTSDIGYLTEEAHQEIYKRCDVKEGDVLLTKDGSNTGSLCINDLSEPFSLLSSVAFLRGNPAVAKSDFIFQILSSDRGQREILKSVAGQAITRITLSKLRDYKFNFPTLPEQRKIAAFLGAVDTKIAHLSRKKSLLEDYKKGCIQQLFSQKIRFKDDDGNDFPDWEEKRLGKIATFSKGKGISKADIADDGENLCVRYGELYTEYREHIGRVVSKTNTPLKGAVLSKRNDILMPTSDVTPSGLATASALDAEGVILGGDILIIRAKKILNRFFSYFVGANKPKIMRLVSGVTVYHIYGSDLATLHISVPHLDEQRKIADFLSALDRKIDLVAQELTHARSFKAGLLQQMFV